MLSENRLSENRLSENRLSENRPWGFFEILNESANYKLNKIVVNPNKKLSLQSHQKRAEHWICLSGKGKAQINNNFIDLKPDINVFININDKHRLINDSNEDLIIIELQTGSYFGEDDIIRYEDDYGRIE